MTTEIENPYWDEITRTDALRTDRSRLWEAYDVNRALLRMQLRDDLTARYSWAISDPETVRFVAHWLAHRAVEMGAGTGYWAWLLRQSGVDMLAFDRMPASKSASSRRYNHWHTPRDHQTGKALYQPMASYSEVLHGTPPVLRRYPDRTLFLCWPPYADPMAAQSLATYAGQRVVYIGEDDGGCTADDAFHAALVAGWECIAEHTPKQWTGIHDVVMVYERVKQMEG